VKLVAQWRPDLVYLSDDEAVAQVARPLAGSGCRSSSAASTAAWPIMA
jgi:mevalonate pyrophosphate decarboxylase